jgi:hypothetical protein
MNISHVRWIRSASPDTDAVLAHAGHELARYGRRLTGSRWDAAAATCVTQEGQTVWLGIVDQLPAPPAGRALTPDPWDDGYALWREGDVAFIAGRNARSVLYGVYALLEQQGVRYLRPGPQGEVIPHVEELALPAAPLVEEPRYRHRGICLEGAPSLAHALDMVDWCAKKRLNTLFLQFFSSRYFYNLWAERTYNPQYADEPIGEAEALAYDDQVIAATKKRGLILHRVGHGWTADAFGLPRSGWVQADEAVPADKVRWLAEVGGERALYGGIPINTELCYSHRPAFDALVEHVVRYCEAHPELDVVHVWLSDAPNNKCECADCRKLSISDWYAKIINALSQELGRRVPLMRFVFLCYFELLWPPEQIEISAAAADRSDHNAIMMFAPIARCYGHSLADADCDDGQEWPRPPLNRFAASRHNAFYRRSLAAWRAAFGGDSFDFDYHLMWAIWSQLTDTQLARLLHEDLQHLKEMGLGGLLSCQSLRAFYPSGLAMAALAESLWNPDLPWEDMRRRYLQAAYGEQAAWSGAYLDEIESALDTGDPHWRTPPLSNADQDKLAACAEFLDASLPELEARRDAAPDRVRRRSFELLVHHARLLRFYVRAYRARLAGEAVQAEQAFDGAAAFLRDTEPEYSTEIDTMLALQALAQARQHE